jgi:hypothetical protein
MKEMVDSVRHELSRVADNYREIATRLEIGRQVLELTAQETMLSGYQRYRCMCLVARPRFRFKHSSGSYVCGGMSTKRNVVTQAEKNSETARFWSLSPTDQPCGHITGAGIPICDLDHLCEK